MFFMFYAITVGGTETAKVKSGWEEDGDEEQSLVGCQRRINEKI